MTPEAQQIAIAEACGLSDISKIGERLMHGGTGIFLNVPDYLNDLNAMHEAEKVLSRWQVEKYLDVLSGFTEGRGNSDYVWYTTVFATAAQRAEAFLRTIGKWEASK